MYMYIVYRCLKGNADSFIFLTCKGRKKKKKKQKEEEEEESHMHGRIQLNFNSF
jgi:hypothetical protein